MAEQRSLPDHRRSDAARVAARLASPRALCSEAHVDPRYAVPKTISARAASSVTPRHPRRTSRSREAAHAAHRSTRRTKEETNEAWLCQHAAIGPPESDDC